MKKKIIITGGSGLLGKEFTTRLVNEGYYVINFDVSKKNGVESEFYKVDITNLNDLKKTIDKVIAKHNFIYGLVNNAYPRTTDWNNSFEIIKYQSWKKNIDYQLNSCFNISQLIISHMITNKIKGSIINIASIYGVVGNDFNVYKGTDINPPAAYSAIKGGIINFTRYLASYCGKYEIRVNSISPGGIFDNQPKKFVNNYVDKVPLKRMGKPSDISPALSYLLSDDSSYVTGQNIIIDGGWTSI